MKRRVVALDRLCALVLGVALIALGVGAVMWRRGALSWARPTLSAGWLVSATAARWWPWAAGAAGVLLILVGLWWLSVHVPRRGLGEIRLPGSDAAGILRANSNAIAAAAADSLAESPGVQAAVGCSLTDRGRPTIAVTATLDPMADLAAVRDSAERVRSEIAQVLGGAELATRIHLHVGKA
ncbi:MAG: hypothetical protein ABI251_04225 [Mycobacteriaceae bacterium]